MTPQVTGIVGMLDMKVVKGTDVPGIELVLPRLAWEYMTVVEEDGILVCTKAEPVPPTLDVAGGPLIATKNNGSEM